MFSWISRIFRGAVCGSSGGVSPHAPEELGDTLLPEWRRWFADFIGDVT